MTDTLIERGENSLKKQDYFSRYPIEKILDGKDSKYPCNYNLAKIIPPKELNFRKTKKRPVLICPPYTRKPGIEILAETNQASVAWSLGYEVYYLPFNPTPVDGQEIDDTVRTLAIYIKYLQKLHANRKPILFGNCQAGWHAFLVGLHDPNLEYTLSAIGTPLSYWSGDPNDDSLRFSGAATGGAWIMAFLSDLIGGKVFDAASLSLNFDALHNEENFLIGRWLRTFLGIDTGKEGFLEMESWMTSFCQLSRRSMMWIVRNLFIGNKLEQGKAILAGKTLSMKDHGKLLIIMNSLGDNIATIWQCQSWIPAVWGNLENLKKSGKTIVVVTHPTAGHLGIFFSGKVAKQWHGAILKSMEQLENLPPGLFKAFPGENGELVIEEMSFEEIPKPNLQGKTVLKKAAAESERNLSVYEKYISPLVKGFSPWTKDLLFHLHPYRLQRYPFMFSKLNPLHKLTKLLAGVVKKCRKPDPDQSKNFFKKVFDFGASGVSNIIKSVHDLKVSGTRQLACAQYSF